MNRMTKTLAAASFAGVLAAAGAFAHEPAGKAPTAKPAAHTGHTAQAEHAGHSAGSMELHRIMEQGHKMPAMSGNVDKDFAAMMTMHHQQAIRMADVQIKHGKNAQLKAMARKMHAEQQKEIKQLAPYTR